MATAAICWNCWWHIWNGQSNTWRNH